MEVIYLKTLTEHGTKIRGAYTDSSLVYIHGTVWDSANNYTLASASIGIFSNDSVVQRYTICDGQGKFNISSERRDILLIVSFAGYKSFSKRIALKEHGSDSLDLLNIKLARTDKDELDNVVIKSIMPVRLNGDTLEFNADAFRLDKNAVVEDLLRVLPGVTLWGDGSITVNGKKVNNVYVDGKPFFGGDLKVASQNLDKQVVDKIQVYKQNNLSDPTDSILNVNIKLKQEHKKGLFGKFASGLGTQKRFEGDLVSNGYNRQAQLTLGGNFNNINKTASDINMLLRNTTYKGGGSNTDYLSDFSVRGINRPISAGYKLFYDFLNTSGPTNLRENLTSDYFFNHNSLDRNEEGVFIYNIASDSGYVSNRQKQNKEMAQTHFLKENYNSNNALRSLNLAASYRNQNTDRTSFNNVVLTDVAGNKRSYTNDSYQGKSSNEVLNLTFGYSDLSAKQYNIGTRNEGIVLNNSFLFNRSRQKFEEQFDFESLINAQENRHYKRANNDHNKSISDGFNADFMNFGRLVFGHRLNLAGIKLKLSNSATYDFDDHQRDVSQFDSATNVFERNEVLSNNRQTLTFSNTTTPRLEKIIKKASANRFEKVLIMNVGAKLAYRFQDNSSIKDFQNIALHNTNVNPVAGISYVNSQFGEFVKKLDFRLDNNIIYPNINQLAPITDSSSNFLRLRNRNLVPESRNSINLDYSYVNKNGRDDINYNISGIAEFIRNSIIDSAVISPSGSWIYKSINTQKNVSRFSLSGNLNFAYKLSKISTFQIGLKSAMVYSNPLVNLSGLETQRRLLNNFNDITFYYELNDRFSLKLTQHLNIISSTQKGDIDVNEKMTTHITEPALSVSISKSLIFQSNGNFSVNKSERFKTSFFVWNSALIYRFLNKKNAEVKVSVFDLFNNNKTINNYVTGVGIGTDTYNSLKRYFMLTLAYHPRFF